MHKVLLTGATGFIGSHLLEVLLSNGFDVTIIKRSTSNIHRIEPYLNRIEVFNIEEVALESIFLKSKFDTVVHLATCYIKNDAEANIKEMYDFNVNFAKSLLTLSVENRVKKFINASSYFQYAPTPLPMTELNEHLPYNEYAKTKTIFQNFLRTWSGKINIYDFIIFSPYGPNDNDKLVMHVIKKALRNEPVILSEGLQKIDLIYVKDIAAAFLKAIRMASNPDGCYHDINLAGGKPLSVREIVSLIEELETATLEKKWGAPSASDYPLVFGDISKADELIGWKPTTHIKQGLTETIEHCKRHFKL